MHKGKLPCKVRKNKTEKTFSLKSLRNLGVSRPDGLRGARGPDMYTIYFLGRQGVDPLLNFATFVA